MTFTGFPATGLAFLTDLGGRDRDWFQANRSQYDVEVAQPAKEFVAAMTDRLQADVSPLIVGQPKTNGSISPINNDLRFNPGARPYKDHLLMKWWEGDDKKTAPTLWVRLSEHDVGFASGIALGDLERWREAVGDEGGARLSDSLAALDRRVDLDVAGQGYKRVPKPWSEDHPRAELLKHKMFQARWPEPTPNSVTTPAFVDFCADRLSLAADIHRWLVDQLR